MPLSEGTAARAESEGGERCKGTLCRAAAAFADMPLWRGARATEPRERVVCREATRRCISCEKDKAVGGQSATPAGTFTSSSATTSTAFTDCWWQRTESPLSSEGVRRIKLGPHARLRLGRL